MTIHPMKLFILLFSLSLVAACTGTPEKEDEAAAGGAVVESRGEAGGEGATTMGAEGPAGWAGSALDDPSSPLSNRTVEAMISQWSQFIMSLSESFR